MSRNIVLKGGSLSGNEGAAAMTVVAIEMAKRSFPGAHITLVTPRPEADKKRANRLGVEIIGLPQPKKSFMMLCGMIAVTPICRYLRIPLGSVFPRTQIAVYESCDLCLDINGDMLTEDYGLKTCLEILWEFLYLKMLKKDYLILPQSIGPFRSRLARWLARAILKDAKLICAREKISLNHLQELRIHKKVELYPDLGFFLKPSKKNVLALARAYQYVGISISELVSHFSNQGVNREGYIDIMANFVGLLVRKFNFRVILIPHVMDPGNDDRKICREVLWRCRYKANVQTIEEDYDAAELKEIIGHSDFFVGSRMHANIAALSQNIPTIAIAYSHKFEGIMQDYGLRSYVINIAELNLDKLWHAFVSLKHNRKKIIKTMKSRNQEQSKLYNELQLRIKNEFR